MAPAEKSALSNRQVLALLAAAISVGGGTATAVNRFVPQQLDLAAFATRAELDKLRADQQQIAQRVADHGIAIGRYDERFQRVDAAVSRLEKLADKIDDLLRTRETRRPR